MMKPHRYIYWGLLISIAFLNPIDTSAATSSEKKVPFPIAEVGSIVSNWFAEEGYEVFQEELNMGQVRLVAVNGGDEWRILLKPSSPLATVVNIKTAAGTPVAQSRLSGLWQLFSGGAAGLPDGGPTDLHNIPGTVSAKLDSVICIYTVGDDQEMYQASGFMIDSKGHAICTAHNLAEDKEITVVFYDGRQKPGRVVHIDAHRDLSLIKFRSDFETSVALAEGRNMLEGGEPVYSVGCPNNVRGTIHSGTIEAVPRRAGDLPVWQVDMEIYPGSSGSPVFDARGNFVGIIKGRYRGTETVGFIIPYETLIDFLDASNISMLGRKK
jgi:serine protease Do